MQTILLASTRLRGFIWQKLQLIFWKETGCNLVLSIALCQVGQYLRKKAGERAEKQGKMVPR